MKDELSDRILQAALGSTGQCNPRKVMGGDPCVQQVLVSLQRALNDAEMLVTYLKDNQVLVGEHDDTRMCLTSLRISVRGLTMAVLAACGEKED